MQELLPDLSNKHSIDRRTTAYDLFKTHGIPGKNSEEYKFTPMNKFLKGAIDFSKKNTPFSISKEEVQASFYDIEGIHLVFGNGIFISDYSKLDDTSLIVSTIGEEFNSSSNKAFEGVADFKNDPFSALNSAISTDGLSIVVSDKQKKETIFIYHIIDATAGQVIAHPRMALEVNESCAVNVIEKSIHLGDGPIFINPLTEVLVHKNGYANVTKPQIFNKENIVVDGMHVSQQRDSKFVANTFSFSGKVIRNNLNIRQDDENCESIMNGLYLIHGKSHVDNHTTVDHRHPHSYSNELYKGILDEKSRAVFNGKIFVRPKAQQTNAFQSNNNINLSDDAVINTKPQLEIWADDVKCSHGCTIGQLDEEAIFYLRARGLDKTSAMAMLLIAYAEDTLKDVPVVAIKDEISDLILDRLGI